MIEATSLQPTELTPTASLSKRSANMALRYGYNLPADAARLYCDIITHKVRAYRGVGEKTIREWFDYAVFVG